MKIYLCGGAVRDQVMGRVPKDFDYLVVGATPADMLAQGFEQVGADFPVFLHPVTREEYALARTERKNGSGYHGFDVSFDPTVTIHDDLARRDLTINSMARETDEFEDALYDPFGGADDIKNKILRHTSPAFSDDPLRVIRLARFAARMPEFVVHDTTFALCKRMVEAGELNQLPFERFAAEIVKVLADATADQPASRFFQLLRDLEVDKYVTFFKYMNMDRLARVATVVTYNFPPDERAENFAAMSYGGDSWTVQIGGAEAKALRDLLIQNRDQDGSEAAARLTQLCSRIGYQNPDRLDHYLRLMACCTAVAGINYEFESAMVDTAYRLMQAVPSQLVPGLQALGKSGREIGQEIANVRHQIAAILTRAT